MATLIVRQVDEEIVDELKERARKAGRSAEAEHRLILKRVLERKKGGGADLWKRLRERAPKLTDAEWETVDRAIQAARGRSATSTGHDDEEEAAGRTS